MEARLTEILQEKFQTGLEQATNEQVYYALLTLTKELCGNIIEFSLSFVLWSFLDPFLCQCKPDRKAFIQQPDQPWNL